jgi:hypothetical protein
LAPSPGLAERLAREAADDQVDRLDLGPVDVVDVAISGHIGEVTGEDAGAIGVDFDLPSAPPSGALQAEVEPSDPSEERAEGRPVIHQTRRGFQAPGRRRAIGAT